VAEARDNAHFRLLERLYLNAPVTRLYGTTVVIGPGEAVVTLPVDERFHHAAGALHGSAIFRALDDAAFFAANSVVHDVLVLTTSFTIQYFRPVRSGTLTATGRLVHQGGRTLFADSELRDEEGNLIATGRGTFTKSGIPLADL
jgi:uncharacterized protein (TIGR00369 family)